MMVSFDNPAWWLLAVAFVPLLVHLVARALPKERPFSSLGLLQELLRRHLRRTRPRDWLLLLLRSLACLCLAAAFLLPRWGGGRQGEGGRVLIVALDDTASMGASDGQQVRMNKAIEVARRAVDGLAPADRINLVRLAGYPHFLFERPQNARPLVLRELARTQSLPLASAAAEETLQEACRQLRSLPEGVQGQLLLISDFQEGTMKKPLEALLSEGKGLDIRCVSVAQSPALGNTAVTGLTLTPARPLPGQDAIATVQLRHSRGGSHEQPPDSVLVTLSAEDMRLSQPCPLDLEGCGEVSFQLPVPSSGGNWTLAARVEGDAFPGDDVRYLVVPVADKLNCLALAADRAQLGFMLRALGHIPFLRVLYLPALPEDPADILVWNAPGAEDVAAIQARLAEGSTVLLVPDLVRDTACCPLIYGKPGVFGGEVREDGLFWQLQGGQEGVEGQGKKADCFALLADDAFRSLCASGIYARLGKGFGADLPKGASPLLRYQDGVPALLRLPVGKGTLLVWNMPVNTRDSRLGFSPFFLPMLAEVLKHSRGGLDAGPTAMSYLSKPLPAGMDPATVRLLNQEGKEVPLAYTVHDAGKSPWPTATSFVPPGIYRWMSGEREWAASAVNFPLEESELRSFEPPPAAEDDVGFQSAEDALQEVGQSSARELWPWLLGASFLFILLDLLICRLWQVRPPVLPS